MIHLFLADGFEEIEALTTLDILRRCKLQVQIVSITGTRLIRGTHNIPVMAEAIFRRSEIELSQGLILPGGMPGARNLYLHEGLRKMLHHHMEKRTVVAAICAAPMVLGQHGLLKGRRATCYPGFEDQLTGCEITSELVTEDGNLITGRGPAAAVPFACAIASRFVSRGKIQEVLNGMLF